MNEMFACSDLRKNNKIPDWYRERGGRMVVAKNKEHLRELIAKAIESEGNSCDLNFIDVSQVTDMSWLFNSSAFTGNISGWDVSNVTDMSYMFAHSAFDGDIGGWNVSNVTNMTCMFHDSRFNGDISRWDVGKVANMFAMFEVSPLERDNKLPPWYR